MSGDIVTSTRTGGEPWEIHLARIGVGIVAGIVVALAKYAGSDAEVAQRIGSGNLIALLLSMLGYSLLPIIFGAVGGWISDERRVHKIFWFAIAAPVIIAAAAGANTNTQHAPETLPVGKAGWNFELLSPVTSAYAEEARAAELPTATLPAPMPNSQSTNPFVQGLQLFLGVNNREQARYRLVVHSVKDDKKKAEEVATRLNREFPNLPAPATVGERKPGNDYWPIVLDGWTTYPEAKRLKDAISNMNFGFDSDDNPYISVQDR
jgi:hypothetical protein